MLCTCQLAFVILSDGIIHACARGLVLAITQEYAI
jgi:hypothetical protein